MIDCIKAPKHFIFTETLEFEHITLNRVFLQPNMEKVVLKMDNIEKYRVLLLMKWHISGNLQFSYGSSYGLKEHKTV